MVKKNPVPDAWDDDWESQADKIASEPHNQPEPEPQKPQTRAERLAQHAETNRRIWESADSGETFHFVEANNTVPLTSSFKPQVKVLSRKPVIAKRDPTTGMSQLAPAADDDDEDGGAAVKEPQPTPEEIRAKQRRDREEKQRRYDEARAKIFGGSAPSSGTSSPGTVTPPRSDGQHAPRGRGRGGRGGGQKNNDGRQFDGKRPNNPSAPSRELYDPGYSPSPESSQGRGGIGEPSGRMSTARNEQQAIRAPRGPDGSGRGGFGFARRGARES